MSKYNANVRTGNWYYELILQEEKAKQYMKKSKNAELKVQKTRLLFLYMLKEVPLTFPVAGLSFGAVIQIVSPEMPTVLRYKLKPKQGIALGADIDFRHVDTRREFADGDPVIGTGLLTPCVRNVWTLVPEEKNREGTELRFGDIFQIQLYSCNPPLYLQCLAQTPSAKKGESGYVTPTLSSKASTMTRYKVVELNPALRYESEGTPVPAFERIAIVQAANYECLAVEDDTWFPTFFGMECEVSVHTFKNQAKPDPRNFWCFILSSA